MKRLLVMLCVGAMLVTGCGSGGSKTSEPTEKPSQGNKYVEQDFYSVPDELLDEDEIQVTDLQTNAEGEPALYQYAVGSDDEDDTGCSIYEYTLNSAGDWQTKQYGRKALTKLVKKQWRALWILWTFPIFHGEMMEISMPLCRLNCMMKMQILLKNKVVRVNTISLPLMKIQMRCKKTKLQTKVEENGSETDYAKEYDVTEFHVTEDGTPMLVFNSSSAMWFDSVSGTRTNLCESVSDGAFSKRVGYGENEIVYYSMSKKKFGVLDSQTLSRTSEFGDDISEDNKKYEWYFDSDTTNWQMYAFNLSGLYRFSDFGQKTSATRLSADGNFDSLADDVIYDVLVGANQELYLLVRRTNESQIESETTYDSGVIKYVPANK